MKARTMAQLRREPTEHTSWCARDHRCGVAEHRSADLIADGVGGRAVITRIRAGNVEYAEVRMRIPLSRSESTARRQLAAILELARRLLATVAAIHPDAITRRDRPAIDRRPHR
jgi:hypothetical protein